METNHKFTDLLRLLADSDEHPDPCSSPLSNITDLSDQAVPLLIEALTHDDPVIRRTAAESLGQLRFPVDSGLNVQSAIPHLETMMASDPDTLIRLHAAEALWIITRNRKVVPGLIEALSDKDVEVRRFAVSMVGLVEADLQDVMQPLIAALADPNPFVRGTAAMVLADYGKKKPPRYCHILNGYWRTTSSSELLLSTPSSASTLQGLRSLSRC